MLALAGIPGTVGFIGKFQLIHALVDGDYTWLAIVLVIGSMISLGYYLRVVATMWMGPPRRRRRRPPAGAGPDRRRLARGRRRAVLSGAELLEHHPRASTWPGADQSAPAPESVLVAVLFAAASVFFGIFPSPMFHLAAHAGHALSALF